MAKDFSFDVVSQVDMQMTSEAVQTTLKENTNRFDFRGTDSKCELDQKESVIKLESADEFKIKALLDVLLTRLSKRGLPVKNFNGEKIENALGGRATARDRRRRPPEHRQVAAARAGTDARVHRKGDGEAGAGGAATEQVRARERGARGCHTGAPGRNARTHTGPEGARRGGRDERRPGDKHPGQSP